jgi:hypothetical protein
MLAPKRNTMAGKLLPMAKVGYYFVSPRRSSMAMRDFSVILALCLCCGVLPAADQSDAETADYRPPSGFNGHAWQTPLANFNGLVPDPISVRIANSAGAYTTFDVDRNTGEVLDKELSGAGSHAVAEYFVDSQGFRVTNGKGKTVLFPVSYQFCAHWNEGPRKLFDNMLERLKLCGVRLYFKEEADRTAQQVDENYQSHFDRILQWLIDSHGDPEGYVRRGTVRVLEVEPSPQQVPQERATRYQEWRWCPPKGLEIAPQCSASILLSFDSQTRIGLVLYVTEPVWKYAYARQYGGSEGDPLYKLLHGRGTPHDVIYSCTGTFICKPPPPKAMNEEMLARFRLPAKQPAVRNGLAPKID